MLHRKVAQKLALQKVMLVLLMQVLKPEPQKGRLAL